MAKHVNVRMQEWRDRKKAKKAEGLMLVERIKDSEIQEIMDGVKLVFGRDDAGKSTLTYLPNDRSLKLLAKWTMEVGHSPAEILDRIMEGTYYKWVDAGRPPLKLEAEDMRRSRAERREILRKKQEAMVLEVLDGIADGSSGITCDVSTDLWGITFDWGGDNPPMMP